MIAKTPQEIEAQIEEQVQREDVLPYLNKVYDGNLPEEFIEQFRAAMMYLPPASHGLDMKKVKIMSTRMVNEVTVNELGLMINVIYSIPFASMYQSLEEGIEKTLLFDKIRAEYNRGTEAFERKIAKKKNTLRNLLSPGNTAQYNGLHKS